MLTKKNFVFKNMTKMCVVFELYSYSTVVMFYLESLTYYAVPVSYN